MIITSYFSSAGAPAPGISPVVRIWMVTETTTTLYVGYSTGLYANVDLPMTEVGDGFYKFDFDASLGYNENDSFLVRVDGGGTLSDSDRYQSVNITPTDSLGPEAISDQVWEEATLDHVNMGTMGEYMNQIKADTNSILISETTIYSLITTLLKYSTNRTKIDVNAAQMIIYDDDGTTPLTVFDLKDFAGLPSVMEVCERLPQV